MKVTQDKDRRKIDPQLLKAIASAVCRKCSPLPSNYKLAKQFGVAPATIYKVRTMVAKNKLTAEQILTMPDEELCELFYVPEEIVMRKGSLLVQYPNFKQEALRAVEGGFTNGEMYKQYKQSCQTEGKAALSLSQYYRNINEARELFKIKDIDYHLSKCYNYGVELQIDHCGLQITINTPKGPVQCSIFVAVWPKSYYTEARFVRTRRTEDTCRALLSMFLKWRKVPFKCVPDNDRALVNRHPRGWPEAIINASFEQFMSELGIYVAPTPVMRPQSKSAVEFGVFLVQRLIKRHWDEFQGVMSIYSANRLLQRLIDQEINSGKFRGSESSTRMFLFKTYELPAAADLPKHLPTYGNIVQERRVPRDFRIKIKGHDYSVPYLYVNQIVTAKVTDDYVEFIHKGKVIARHLRDDKPGESILDEHKPPEQLEIEQNQRIYGTPEAVMDAADQVDPEGVGRFCHSRLTLKQGPNDMRCCISVLKHFNGAAYKGLFSKACRDVLNLGTRSWTSYEIQRLYNESLEHYLKESQETSIMPVPFAAASDSELHLHNDNETNSEEKKND